MPTGQTSFSVLQSPAISACAYLRRAIEGHAPHCHLHVHICCPRKAPLLQGACCTEHARVASMLCHD